MLKSDNFYMTSKSERINKILEQVYKNNLIKVEDLSRFFNVSNMTIIRDLNDLDRKGYLKKVYGGAIKISGINVDGYNQRIKKNAKEKERIAVLATKFIEDGKTFFIGPGTTLLCLMKKWPKNSNCTILTNGINMMLPEVLNTLKKVEIHSTGGVLNKEYLAMTGPSAENEINSRIIDTAFICCYSISGNLDLYEPDIFQSAIIRKVIDMSKKTMLLADHTKFGTSKGYKCYNSCRLSCIITSKKTPKEYLDKISKNNIELLLTD